MRMPVALALSLAITSATSAFASDMPPRKAGLWVLETKTTGGDGRDTPHISRYCIDAVTEQEMNTKGARLNPDRCSKQVVQRSGDTIAVEAVCKINDVTLKFNRVVTASDDTAYTMKTASRREAGTGLPTERQTTVEAKWTGDCSGDLQAGEMILTNGMKMNMLGVPKAQ
jgi:hypothetical protein